MQKCRLWSEIEISCILMQNFARWIFLNLIFIQISGFFTVIYKIFLVSKFDLKQIYTISTYFLEKKILTRYALGENRILVYGQFYKKTDIFMVNTCRET